MSKSTSSIKKGATAGKATSKPAAHPSYIDMVKECIATHPEDARYGVSRPTIKKYIETKYKVEMNASATSQLSRAIISGVEKDIFVLPKGLSGKVKLAPKVKSDVIKEVKQNTKEVKKTNKSAKEPSGKAKTSKSSSSTKENKKPVSAKGATAKTKAQTSKTPAAKPKPKAAKAVASKPAAKKAPVKSSTKKQTTAKPKPAAKKASGKAPKKETAAKAAAVKRQRTSRADKPIKLTKAANKGAKPASTSKA